MYDLIIKLTNGDDALVSDVQYIQERSNNSGEITIIEKSDFQNVHPYSNYSYVFVGKDAIFNVLGNKIEYLHFRKG